MRTVFTTAIHQNNTNRIKYCTVCKLLEQRSNRGVLQGKEIRAKVRELLFK